MEILISESRGVSTVEPKGRIDSVTAKEFGDRVCALIRSGANRLVIDLASIAYISSAGFRALLIAGKDIEETDGRLALCGVVGEVRRLFDISAFTERFLICSSREEGITKVQAG